MYPLVTIVVTSHNRANLVRCTLDSVYKQTYRPIELIIIDDGSQDQSMEVITQWILQHPAQNDWSCLVKHFPQGGLTLARNRGLTLSHGKYIQFVDDDDWLYPNCINEKISYALQNSNCDIIINQADYYRNQKSINQTQISIPEKKENILEHLLMHETLLSAVLMFKTAILKKMGGWNEDVIFAEDAEITLKMAIYGSVFGIVNKSLSGVRLHGQPRMTTNVRDCLSDDFISRFYLNIYHLACDRSIITKSLQKAFIERLKFDAEYNIKRGRYRTAEGCLAAANEIISGSCYVPVGNIPFRWYICHSLFVIKQRIKLTIFKIMTFKSLFDKE